MQSPSHTYTAAGTYTVALTATNSGGSDTCTKTNYITVAAFQADFTATPTWGLPPLAVQLHRRLQEQRHRLVVDLRRWRYQHGAEPEPHLHHVGVLHRLAAGQQRLWLQHLHQDQLHHRVQQLRVRLSHRLRDGRARAVGTSTWCPERWPTYRAGPETAWSSPATRRSSIKGYNWCNVTWTAPTGYTPSQIAGITLDWQAMTPTYLDICGKQCPWPDGQRYATGACCVQYMPNTFTDYAWTQAEARLVANNLLDSNGNVTFNECHMPYTNKTTENFTIAVNLVRWKVFLNPTASAPVANFSGTPTAARLPLAVTFTDSLHEHSDRVVLDLRRLRHLHGAESVAHLHARVPTPWP